MASTEASPGGAARNYIYFFGDGAADGCIEMRSTLGGKGAGLAQMARAGLPVPPEMPKRPRDFRTSRASPAKAWSAAPCTCHPAWTTAPTSAS